MLYIVIFFFMVSIFLYCLLGGADFGAGIVELTARGSSKERARKLISKAMAPIWEANHMWLIIAVVILFNAFPKIYSQVSISLYIPLILLLVGIVLRGTAFTFRHYDAVKDFSQEVYSKAFSYSSIMVSFFFGLVVGALVSGKIPVYPANFLDGYIFPWFNLFSISVGIFICSLFAFIASVFLLGDTADQELIKDFIIKSKIAIIVMVISGGLVFVSSLIEGVGFTKKFISNPISITLIAAATALLPLLWKVLSKGWKWLSRFLVGVQLSFIIGAFYSVYFPAIVKLRDAEDLTLYNSAAPEITLTLLAWALMVGSVIIFPSLFFLFKVFKLGRKEEPT